MILCQFISLLYTEDKCFFGGDLLRVVLFLNFPILMGEGFVAYITYILCNIFKLMCHCYLSLHCSNSKILVKVIIYTVSYNNMDIVSSGIKLFLLLYTISNAIFSQIYVT